MKPSRNARRRLLSASILTLALWAHPGSDTVAPARAQTVDPPDCGPDLDGVTWTDPHTGGKWECKQVGEDVWEWRPAQAEASIGKDPGPLSPRKHRPA